MPDRRRCHSVDGVVVVFYDRSMCCSFYESESIVENVRLSCAVSCHIHSAAFGYYICNENLIPRKIDFISQVTAVAVVLTLAVG
jgi:hypothetical protein